MASHEQYIDFPFQARYETLGELNQGTTNIWMVFHGYGQLAKYFIRKFDVLAAKGHFIVAPEGLSRFYLAGFEGRVGATWMTREGRTTDIQNYVTYLDAVFHDVNKNLNNPKVELNLLGFSQGAATVCRWLVESKINFDNLFLWAGIFPPDLQLEQAISCLSNKSVKLIIGDTDPYITPQRMEEMQMIREKLMIKVEVVHYSGGHHIDREVLRKLV